LALASASTSSAVSVIAYLRNMAAVCQPQWAMTKCWAIPLLTMRRAAERRRSWTVFPGWPASRQADVQGRPKDPSGRMGVGLAGHIVASDLAFAPDGYALHVPGTDPLEA